MGVRLFAIVGVGLPDDPAVESCAYLEVSAKAQRAVGDAGPYIIRRGSF